MRFGNLWRIFIPTWRLFNRPGARTRFLVRQNGEWVEALTKPPIPWYTLIYNPRGNLYHAQRNLLERFVDESREVSADALPDLVSFQLLKEFAGGHEFQVVVE